MTYLSYLTPLVEILCIAFMVNYLLRFFWGTRAMDLILGFIALLVLFSCSRWFGLPVLEKILFNIVNVAVLAVLILFQPELRLALSKLHFKGRRHREVHAFDEFLEALALVVYRLAERRTGALIVLEKKDALHEFLSSGLSLQAQFSAELLETLFVQGSPLHDGAVVIRGRTIVAARVILPLTEESTLHLSSSMGTRHRAALGISQKSDAVALAISEETGRVSIARDGILTRGVKIDRFKGILRSLFVPSPLPSSTPFKLLGWFRS